MVESQLAEEERSSGWVNGKKLSEREPPARLTHVAKPIPPVKVRRVSPKPEEGGPHIKKQVRTLSMRKVRKTLVKILTHPTKDPTPFTLRITRFKYHRRVKLPRNIRVYEGNKDPEDHLSIFSAAAEQEEWPMPVWCKMFCQTLGGAARNWFDDLDPKSMNSFEELSQKFVEEFSQQKDTPKTP
ncbi:hypothetical protein Tco_0149322 [Tanacetum coccineum]